MAASQLTGILVGGAIAAAYNTLQQKKKPPQKALGKGPTKEKDRKKKPAPNPLGNDQSLKITDFHYSEREGIELPKAKGAPAPKEITKLVIPTGDPSAIKEMMYTDPKANEGAGAIYRITLDKKGNAHVENALKGNGKTPVSGEAAASVVGRAKAMLSNPDGRKNIFSAMSLNGADHAATRGLYEPLMEKAGKAMKVGAAPAVKRTSPPRPATR